jgi:hypothetical protein
MPSINLPDAYRAITRFVATQFLPCFLNGRAAQFSASILYGYGVLRQQYGVQVLS